MKVIGISPLDKDSTVSFMEDGKIIFACGEERLSRTKLQDGFPRRAMKLGFERTGWSVDDIDQVAYAFYDGEEETRLMYEAADEDSNYHPEDCTRASLDKYRELVAKDYKPDFSVSIPGLDEQADEFMPSKSFLKSTLYKMAASKPAWDWKLHKRFFNQWLSTASSDHKLRTKQLAAGLKEFGLESKLKRYNHHDTHAANAFYASGYKEALLVTLDGYGSGNCGGVYVGNSDGLECLQKFSFPNSLGQFYEMVTSALGFKPGRHEGKIVGLAAYGNPDLLGPVLRERFVVENGDIKIRASMNYYFARDLAQRFSKRDVAAAYQEVLEQITREVCEYWVAKTGMRNVAVSGGVNANVKLNQRIHEINGVDSVFAYPNMGDGGCGSGAAMLAFNQQVFQGVIDNVYLGPDYTNEEIEAALRKENLPVERSDNVEDRVGELLTQNHIVARFDGRMEYGPRSLGNRSVLYPAQDAKVNLWLNHQLGRTEFMPFAPAALASEAHNLFLNLEGCEKTAEFMTVTFNCTDFMVEKCPAAVHIDRTARPQLVTETSNPGFHKVLQAYYKRSGIPAVINTSFNMHEEPIVCSPDDAVRAFLLGNIDYLAIGSYLVPHPELSRLMEERSMPQQSEVSGQVTQLPTSRKVSKGEAEVV